jgi:hypothetical protein
MKKFGYVILTIALFAVPAFAGVTVSSPKSGETVGSPAKFVATASASGCSKGVASMGVYVDNVLKYVVDAASMNTTIALAAGKYNTVVEEWDKCGGASYTAVDSVSVSGGTEKTGVTVSSPTSGETVGSPVKFVATAASTCSKGVASMGVYVDSVLKYVVDAASMSTSIAVAAGKHNTVVEEWDKCGGASYTAINSITVSGTSAPTAPPPSSGIPSDAISSGDLTGSGSWEWEHDTGTPGTSTGSSTR